MAGPVRPEDLRNIFSYIRKERKYTAPFDVAVIGWGTGKSHTDDLKKIQPLAEAGMTWWLESLFLQRNSVREMSKRIQRGPPRIS